MYYSLMEAYKTGYDRTNGRTDELALVRLLDDSLAASSVPRTISVSISTELEGKD